MAGIAAVGNSLRPRAQANAGIFADVLQGGLMANRRGPLDVPFDPLRQVPYGMTPPLRTGDVAGLALQNVPGIGDAASLVDAYKAYRSGDTMGASLAGLSALPMFGSIKVYHGSPHLFDKFDMGKIGTGEGAQAYGHGLYFAESPQVADEYAGKLSDSFAYIGDRLIDHPSIASVLKTTQYGHKGDAVRNALDNMKRFHPEEAKKLGYIDRWETPIEIRDGGNLYETSLEWPDAAREAADPMGPQHFLDWDKPLSEQPEGVRALFAQYIEPHPRGMKDSAGNPGFAWKGTGEGVAGGDELYRRLAMIKGSSTAATNAIQGQGIPGIRYLDAGSRGNGQGTANYVVFDDQIPRIVNRK
jgi:hypothetical protein